MTRKEYNKRLRKANDRFLNFFRSRRQVRNDIHQIVQDFYGVLVGKRFIHDNKCYLVTRVYNDFGSSGNPIVRIVCRYFYLPSVVQYVGISSYENTFYEKSEKDRIYEMIMDSLISDDEALRIFNENCCLLRKELFNC